MINRVKQLGAQFVALLANPVGLFLLTIGTALASVAAYFKNTNDGADKFEKIMNALGGVADFFVVKIVNLGEQIVKMFEDGNALGTVFGFIFDQIVNRVAGVIDAFTGLLKVINILAKYDLKSLLTGNLSQEDLKALKTELVNMGKAGISALTGIGTAADELGAKIESLNSLTEAADLLGDNIRDRILSKAQALLDIEKQLFIFKDKGNHTDQQRVAALQSAISISEQQLKIDIDIATRRERQFTAELLHKKGIISTEAEANQILAQGTTLLQNQLLEQKAIDSELEERRKLQADILNLQREFFSSNKKNIAQLAGLEKEIADGKIKNAEKERDIRVQILDESLAAAQAQSTAEILGVKLTLDTKEDLHKKFNQRLIDDAKVRAEKEKEIEKQKTEALKEEIEKRQELEAVLFAAAAVAQTLVSEFTQSRKAALDEESKQAEDRRNKELAGAQDNEVKKLAINRKYDREQAKIKQKQAQADKQAALFNILISTAMGIARVAPNPVLIALVAAIGAIQAAFVASKPLPKFWKGTDNSPSNFIAGDRGRELVEHGNKRMLADGPTIFADMPGSKVYTNKETEEMFGNSADVGHALRYGSRPKTSLLNNSIVADRLQESNKLLRKIASKPEPSFIFDDEGFRVYSDKAARRSERLNRRFKGF